jgi:hypothetical protein
VICHVADWCRWLELQVTAKELRSHLCCMASQPAHYHGLLGANLSAPPWLLSAHCAHSVASTQRQRNVNATSTQRQRNVNASSGQIIAQC